MAVEEAVRAACTSCRRRLVDSTAADLGGNEVLTSITDLLPVQSRAYDHFAPSGQGVFHSSFV